MNDHIEDPISAFQTIADENHIKYPKRRLAVLAVLEDKTISCWARNFWKDQLRELDRIENLYNMGVDYWNDI